MDFFYEKDIKDKLNGWEEPFNEKDWHEMEKMLDNIPFDTQIADKLLNFETPYVHYEWQIFDIALKNHSFDSHIQKSLEQPEMELPVSDWEEFVASEKILKEDMIFREKLSAENSLTGIPDFEAFESDWNRIESDNMIREQFREIEENTGPEGWPEMENSLNSHRFDEAISQKLQHHETPPAAGDWMIFNKKLNAAAPEKTTGPVKVLTAALLLLLLMFGGYSGIQYWSGNQEKKQSETDNKNTASDNDVPSPVNPPAKSSNEAEATQKPAENQFQPKVSVVPPVRKETNEAENKSSTRPLLSQFKNKKNNRTSGSKSTIPPVILATINPETAVSRKIPPAVIEKASASTSDIALKPDVLTPVTFNNPPREIPKEGPKTQRELLTIATGKTALKPGYNFNIESPQMDFNNRKFNPELRFSVYGGGIATVVELKDTAGIGFNTGIRGILSINKKWSVVGDLLYSERSFDHLYYKYSAFHNTDRLNFLRGNITSVDFPFMLRRNFEAGNKVIFYAQAGVVPSFTLHENYEHYDPDKINNLNMNDNDIGRMIPTEQQINFQPYVGNVIAGIGLNVQYKKFDFSVEPKFQWCIQAVSMEQKRTYTAGVGVAVGYKLFD